MAKLIVVLLIVFLMLFSVLTFFNKGAVDVTVWKGITYPVPVVALILISTAIGVLGMFMITALRDARRYLERWNVQRRCKREEKTRELYSKGMDAFYSERFDEASGFFQKVVESEPAYIDAYVRLGDIAAKQYDYSASREAYMKAREIKPRSIEIMVALAKLEEAQGNWAEAVKMFDNILEIDAENPVFLRRKRDMLEYSKDWEAVIDVQQKILKCKLSDEARVIAETKAIGYKYELGLHYLNTGTTDKAIKLLKGLLKTDRGFISAYLTLSEAYLKEENTREAEEILVKGYEVTSSIVILDALEDFYIARGEPGMIIDIYLKAVQKDQKNIKLKFFLAKLYYRLEMIDHAMEIFDSIDVAVLDLPDFHLLLGNIYERRAQHEKAVEEYRKMLQIDKHIHLSFCCTDCSHISKQWEGRCPECRKWNTIIPDINDTCKAEKRPIGT
ncbi:MAG: tetratricopeptide repeat protein [Nitrospira sp.]|nr:tetratricopeptide repeat protein [bacterium]MBL7049175.1 tetratricopeptide repeat protein [Nitrospira sp.]